MTRALPCPPCAGTGHQEDRTHRDPRALVTCDACGGDGVARCAYCGLMATETDDGDPVCSECAEWLEQIATALALDEPQLVDGPPGLHSAPGHDAIKASDFYGRLMPRGIQRSYSVAHPDLDLRNCACGTTLARPITVH